MPLRGPRMPAGLVRVNRLAAAVLRPTPARVLLDSLHGDLMLERLYRREAMQYRLIIAERPGPVA